MTTLGKLRALAGDAGSSADLADGNQCCHTGMLYSTRSGVVDIPNMTLLWFQFAGTTGLGLDGTL